ncbi:MAG: GNAT family N-acetyltransferase [Candidatus Euphemobacter frigidus]|nr:GNAT family N-acetyltransferase [Candidatus Euphemobacter frigidus]MDP8275024.1 GNAT family N-acetyltransferase [Candidatus Euphemobacter frigidus]
MSRFRVVTGLEECRDVWEQIMPREVISDLWEVRVCFQKHFRRQPHFIVAEEDRAIRGLLPLSWIEESGKYGYFPGETWEGKTWLEQNRIPARGNGLRQALLDRCPGPYHLRYLLSPGAGPENGGTIDEIGYLFIPPRYEYDMENYFGEFSRKSRKRLRRDLDAFEERGVRYRFNEPDDFEYLVKLNVDSFGDGSYFADCRFTESFRSLMNLFHERGWLRITTIMIKGEIAAVDLGCVFNGVYTLLGGGTHGDFPGVAKLINIHHVRWACERKLRMVDFLCGDFSWKTLFHLTPRPLYAMADRSSPEQIPVTVRSGRVDHAR